VDFLSHIGMGLLKQYRAAPGPANDDRKVIRSGSIEWILAKTKREAERNARQKKVAGW
jgi:hypothetical protein